MFKLRRAKPAARAKVERPLAERERVTPEVLGRELREALRQIRVHSISIHNDECDALWLSEGVLGPDEHSVALEAMGAFGLETSRQYADFDLGDGRGAVCYPARSPYGEVLGLAMVIADTKSIENGNGERLATPEVRAILQRLTVVLRPPSATQTQPIARPDALAIAAAGTASAPAATVALSPVVTVRPAAVVAPPAREATPPAPAPAPAAAQVPVVDPAASDCDMPVIEFSFNDLAEDLADEPVVAPAATPAPAARPADTSADATLYVPQATVREVALHVQQLHKLRSGGRTRRFEVLLRARSHPDADAMTDTVAEMLASQGTTSTMDRYITGELLTWLASHTEVWEREPASFSVNVTLSTLTDEQFLPYVSSRLAEARVAPEVLGFEVPERAFIEHRALAERFVRVCEKLGCFVVLDDFTLHSEALPFLASPAMRLVKIDARLTSAALKEKLPQAIVIAISQAAKVLGVHCVAKRVESQVGRQWLSAIGIDFAQGFLLEKPQPLDDLALQAVKAASEG
ncbi:MAG TPA: EAL domain-containing protein [Steroidobacteraceae bacterium]|nr:EAL domain-containing protein [Steroidobacteraceae bacterium]HNS26788.1 EAL domain-containing protein [Steroidobacteraceae bacterium]